VTEVISQLVGRFKPEVSIIKKRIEDLIVRDYLERPEEEESPNTYRYVA
jgi:cullin 3